MTDNGSSAATVLVSFILGAVAGAALALLYAPVTGEEARRRLAQKAREGRDKAETLAREGRDFYERHKGDIGAAIARGREVFDETRRESL
jgi:gas vesicle protein